ncbi:MAG TPA: response regulator [bacterium]|nr:response regulator [bacterium]
MIVSIVEDDPVVLELLTELLKMHGHDPHPILIESGDTVDSGLARMAENHPDVVVMDVGMPVSGLVLLRAAQEDKRFAKVRYLVASAWFDSAENPPPVGPAVKTIAKPYEVPELLAAIAGEDRRPNRA